jgi:hypothetical protein
MHGVARSVDIQRFRLRTRKNELAGGIGRTLLNDQAIQLVQLLCSTTSCVLAAERPSRSTMRVISRETISLASI